MFNETVEARELGQLLQSELAQRTQFPIRVSRVYANERDETRRTRKYLCSRWRTSLGLSTETVLPPTSLGCLGKRQLSITEGGGGGKEKRELSIIKTRGRQERVLQVQGLASRRNVNLANGRILSPATPK